MANWDVTTSNASLEIDTQNLFWADIVQLDATHFMVSWCGAGSAANSYAQVITVNGSTYAVSTAGSSVNFSGNYGYATKLAYMDTTHCVAWFQFYNTDYRNTAQVLAYSTTTWAVTTASSPLIVATGQNGNTDGYYGDIIKADANHFLVTYIDAGADGFAQVLAVSTSTYAVTTAAAALEFDTQQALFSTLLQADTNHFINIWSDIDLDGKVQVLTVDTTNWTVTTAAALLEFDTQLAYKISAAIIDSTHFITVWEGPGNDCYAQCFAFSTSTWAVSTAGAVFTVDTNSSSGPYSSIAQVDSSHFILFFTGTDNDGYATTLAINTSTYAITTTGSAVEFDTTSGLYSTCAKMDTNHFVNVWQGASSDGFVQAFGVTLPATGPANLKSLNTSLVANIKTINTSTIANTKSWNTIT